MLSSISCSSMRCSPYRCSGYMRMPPYQCRRMTQRQNQNQINEQQNGSHSSNNSGEDKRTTMMAETTNGQSINKYKKDAKWKKRKTKKQFRSWCIIKRQHYTNTSTYTYSGIHTCADTVVEEHVIVCFSCSVC